MVVTALVSKARKPKFELQLKIIDLNNVPLVTGTSFIRWHISHTTGAEHRGRTSKEPIQDHKVTWNYTHIVPVRLIIDSKNNMLHESWINFEVVQEYGHVAKMEKMNLGNISLNLAEYVDVGEDEDGEEGIVRRYLMQDSKINSTLKIGISMRQTDGERNFVAPPLRTAPVFGGITGIVAGEKGENDDVGHLPSMGNKSREMGELQDMYRRTLAASWVAQEDELPADQCIEDLFSGGDGWKDGYRTTTYDVTMPSRDHRRQYLSRLDREDSGSPSGEDKNSPTRRHGRTHSSASGRSNLTVLSKASTRTGVNHARKHSRTGSTHMQDLRPNEIDVERGRQGKPNEVGEFDLREDLIAWRLPGRIQVSE